MLKILFLFLLILAGIVLGPLLAGHQGYVLIQTDNYNIETTVTSLIIMIIIMSIVLFTLEWFLRRICRANTWLRGWCRGRRYRLASRQTTQALLKLVEGDYQQAEKLLTRHADSTTQPIINYLLAAEAAQQRDDTVRASQYLAQAEEQAGADQLPVAITRVRLQLARGEDHAARHGVDKLLEVAPRHPEVLRLAQQAYLRTGAWRALLDTLPALRKVLPEGAISENLQSVQQLSEKQPIYQVLEQQAWIGLMDQARASGGSDGLKSWWRQQSGKIRRQQALQVAMVEHLLDCDDADAAQTLILHGLKQQYNEPLILLIPRLQSTTPEIIEKTLRQQIKHQGDRPLLWSTLGQSLLKRGEWQEASLAFRAALKQRPDAFDYAWLADALEKMHQPDDAAIMRHEGLLLTLRNNPTAS